MSILKQTRDHALKLLSGRDFVPRELLELNNYFRLHKTINFKFEKSKEGTVAISTDFVFGTIITSGKDDKELEDNISDAILTSFEVPSAYAKEANVHPIGKNHNATSYALA